VTAVGLFVHTGKAEAVALATEVGRWLVDHGHEVMLDPAEADLLADVPHAVATPTTDLGLLVSIGGDGTVLRAAQRAVSADADLLGVNLGALGYLAEVEPAGWQDALVAYFDGRHRIESRMLVQGVASGVRLPPALNEVVIEKRSLERTVRLGVRLDGEHFTSYVADGVIVASPTGSTAYSLSARGPIVDPAHRALVMTPVSPHSLFDRSLVLGPSSTIEVTVLGDRDAALSVDGQDHGVLAVGQTIAITATPDPLRFVTFDRRSFHQILKAKFGLSDR
jgi:NAD+ kinase